MRDGRKRIGSEKERAVKEKEPCPPLETRR